MKSLIVVNDAPYGTERCFNALRLAQALLAQDEVEVDVFLLADATSAARRGQKTPSGQYNIELMLKRVVQGGGGVLACGTCMETRGLEAEHLIDGARASNMTELAEMVIAADRVVTF